MGTIVPATWTGPVSDTARSFRKLMPKPALASVVGADDQGSWSKRGFTEAKPSFKHGNVPKKASTSSRIRMSTSYCWLQNSLKATYATQQTQTAVLGMCTGTVPLDSPNRKRKRQDAGKEHVPSMKPRVGRAAKGRTSTSPAFVDAEELVLVNIKGKRLCAVTQHAEDEGRNEVQDVLSIPATTVAPTGPAPTAGWLSPTRLLISESRQPSYNSEFPNEDGCETFGSFESRQGETTCENGICPIDIGPQQLSSSKTTNPTWVQRMRLAILWLMATLGTSLQSGHPETTLLQTPEHLALANLDISNSMCGLSVMSMREHFPADIEP